MKTAATFFCVIAITALSSFSTNNTKTNSKLYPAIVQYIQNAEKDFDKIPADRKLQLKKVALFIQTKLSSEKKVNLVYICTHNSRRSHTGQLWALAAAEYYGIKGVSAYSGGLEITAFNGRIKRK
jgi:protein-tyrosine phosphatase/arsenate reductase